MPIVYTLELLSPSPPLQAVALHFAATTPKGAAELASWVARKPVSVDALAAEGAESWASRHGRVFDPVAECIAAASATHAIAARCRQIRSESKVVMYTRDARSEEYRAAQEAFVRAGAPMLAAEAMAVRLARLLEQVMRGDYAAHHPRNQVPAPKYSEPRSHHEGEAFARRSRLERLEEVHDAATDILGTATPATPEVCQAYAVLDSARSVDWAVPVGEVEQLQEQVDWLCELVDMAYRGGLDLSDPDSRTFTALPPTPLARAVSVAEVRAAISRRPPPLIDRGQAFAAVPRAVEVHEPLDGPLGEAAGAGCNQETGGPPVGPKP